MTDIREPVPDELTINCLSDLVSVQTVTNTSNLEIIDYLERRLAPLGGEMHRSYDESGTKANLLVRLGPRTGPGLILSGHTDVVPVAGQQWSCRSVDASPRGRSSLRAGRL